MTIVLRRWHWMLFIALLLIQLGGWWISLLRSPYGPAVVDFFPSHGLGLWNLANLALGRISSAFGTTVILAKVFEVFAQQKG